MDGAPDFDEYGSSSEPMPDDGAFAGLEASAPASSTPSSGGADKPKTTGNWSCAGCGKIYKNTPIDWSILVLDCFFWFCEF